MLKDPKNLRENQVKLERKVVVDFLVHQALQGLKEHQVSVAILVRWVNLGRMGSLGSWEHRVTWAIVASSALQASKEPRERRGIWVFQDFQERQSGITYF